MTAFATAEQLGVRMRREFNTDEQEWLTALLGDASGYLRTVMGGAWVAPKTTQTYTAYPVGWKVRLPQPFIVSVDSVTRDGQEIPYKRFEDTLEVGGPDPVEVTFSHGLAAVPDLLVGLTCAIVSGQITLVEAELGLSVGGLSSVALDDFKIAFANAGESTGMSIPEPTKQLLREQYGATGYIVEANA